MLRRSVGYALRDVGRAAGMLARQIGGVRTLRDAPGSGRDPLQPVPVARAARGARALITGSLLAADSLRVSPALQRRLGADFDERCEALLGGEGSAQTDYSLSTQVLGLQRALLGALMSDAVAARLLDSSEKAPTGADACAAPVRALRAADAGGLERARRPAATSRRCGANCSASTSTGSPRCCCGPALPAAPTRAACCARRRRRCSSASEARAKRPGLSAEARAHLQTAPTR